MEIALESEMFEIWMLTLHQNSFQVAVVEVSSYQMEIPNRYFCPSVSSFKTFLFNCLNFLMDFPSNFVFNTILQVSVVLNLTPDHMERHKSMKNYAITKCRLFSHMTNAKLGILSSGMC